MLLRAKNDAEDRRSREQLELLQLAKEIVLHPQDQEAVSPIVKKAEKEGDSK
jgi:hypothetical protein